MTEVPEHLLRRSRERRAALGLGGGEGGEGGEGAPPSAAPPSASPPSAAPPSTPPPSAEPGESPEAPSAGAAVEVGVEVGAELEATPTPATPPGAVASPAGAAIAAPAAAGTGVPRWMMPVLVMLPLWAVLYVTALAPHTKAAASLTPVELGNQVFHGTGGCSGCHGANGEGGTGPKLAGGEVLKTFPNVADHVAWVQTGSLTKAKGTPYGDPKRPGGQHVVQSSDMPGFQGTLSDQQIQAVVTYERTL